MKSSVPFQRSGSLIALGILLVVSFASFVHLQRIEKMHSVSVDVELLPKNLGNWQGRDSGGLDLRSQEILQLTHYVKRVYTRKSDGAAVVLYIGYWKEQSGDYQAAKHSPLICLPANGWDVTRKDPIDLSFDTINTGPVTANRLVGGYRGNAQLFYYWFFTAEENYSEEWRALITIGLQKFLTGRSDGGIVEVSAQLPKGMSKDASQEKAAEVIEDFLDELYPALRTLVHETNPQTAGK